MGRRAFENPKFEKYKAMVCDMIKRQREGTLENAVHYYLKAAVNHDYIEYAMHIIAHKNSLRPDNHDKFYNKMYRNTLDYKGNHSVHSANHKDFNEFMTAAFEYCDESSDISGTIRHQHCCMIM